MKNNRLLCSCIPYSSLSAGARSPRYRHNNSLAQVRRIRKVRLHVPKALCGMQDLSFYCTIQLCIPLKKLATHCSRARKLAHFLKRLLIFRWPPMPLTHSVSTFIRHLRIRTWRSGVTDWKNAYRILGHFTTSAAAICSCCSAPQTSRITFNHCQP